MNDLDKLHKQACDKIKHAKTLQSLQELKAEILGKAGSFGQMLREVGKLPRDVRKTRGAELNQVKNAIESAFELANQALQNELVQQELARSRYDVTLPGRRTVWGAMHPLRLIELEAIHCLTALGFQVADGPQVEHDWYNFEALNIPENHPARDMHDTFFVAPRIVLRTHTSNVQIRTMVQQKPPVRIIAPGMVYRRDEVDPTHSPVFHQIEGLWVDDKVTFADMKGVLHRFISYLFKKEVRVRFRPSYFPFTEPSCEMDFGCVLCEGTLTTCRVCRGRGWLEIAGAGMVDPAVLESVGYDPEAVQGFAFGAGIERIAMLRFLIDDIRLFYDNDVRFLQQFRGQGF